MIYKIYSIKDVVTGQFAEIRPMYNEAQAVRWFDGFCQESKIGKDLQLFCLGDYSTDTGEISSFVTFIKNGGTVNA